MEGKISVIGEVHVSATVPAGARGAEVIVASAGEDVLASARLAPAGVLRLVDGTAEDVTRALEATLWPGHRVVGVRSADVDTAVRAVVSGEQARLDAAVRDGERTVTLARAGVVG